MNETPEPRFCDASDGEFEAAPVDAVAIGERLARGREASGRKLSDLAGELRLPPGTLRALESGDWNRLGPAVYVQGYLTAYGRLLDVDVSEARPLLEAGCDPEPQPAEFLRAPPRRRWIRYQRMAAYLAATALVALPAAWLGRAGVDWLLVTTTPMGADSIEAPVRATRLTEDRQPALASMAPVNLGNRGSQEPDRTDSAAHPGSSLAAHSFEESQPGEKGAEGDSLMLVLDFREKSWLEVEDGQGQRLAYGLMPAGSSRSFGTDRGLHVRIGNVDQVSATLGERSFDLSEHQRRDVAEFQLPADPGPP